MMAKAHIRDIFYGWNGVFGTNREVCRFKHITIVFIVPAAYEEAFVTCLLLAVTPHFRQKRSLGNPMPLNFKNKAKISMKLLNGLKIINNISMKSDL